MRSFGVTLADLSSVSYHYLACGLTPLLCGARQRAVAAACYPLFFHLDIRHNNVYKYTPWTAEKLSRSSSRMVGAKLQKSALILSFGIQIKRGVLLFHTRKRTYLLAL
jgi:hypothetical protein